MPRRKIPAITRQQRQKAARAAIRKAVETKGSMVALAAHFDIYPAAIHFWIKNGLVPPARVVELSKITGIPPEDIDPYIFGG